MRIAKSLLSAVCILFFAANTPLQAQTKRSITETDLYQFHWIGDTQIAPDGSRVVFVRVDVTPDHKGYATSLWLLDLNNAVEAPRRLTAGTHDGHPRWSPDSKTIAFARATEKDGKTGKPQIYLLNLAGGEAESVSDLPEGASAPLWSPDGKHLLLTSGTTPEEWKKHESKPDAAKTKEETPESDVRVITRAVYRMNGEGYLDFDHPDHFWMIDIASDGKSGKPKEITHGRLGDSDPVWSPDGSRIYFFRETSDEPYYEPPKSAIYSVPASGGDASLVAAIPFGAQDMVISPDGTEVAFRGATTVPVRSYSEPHLWTIALKPGAEARNVAPDYDYDIGDSIGGDNRAPRAAGNAHPVWLDDHTLLDVATKEGRANLVKIDLTNGKVSDFTSGNQTIQLFSLSADHAKAVGLVSTPLMIGDLFSITADGKENQLTHINDELFAQLNLAPPEEITYKSFDGKRIQAWVQKPCDFDPHKKYPLILNIHGGPHTAYGYVFDHEFLYMAAKGYVVLYPNPRGSTSYGQEFGNIIQYHYPGDDYKDLMAGVDELIRRGYIDDKKLGVTGGSGGGLLTDWTVTQTTRFVAAVSQRDISDWTSWWYTADFTLFQPTWFKGPPFETPEDFRARSPITNAKKIQTPMMFILGEADYRTPPTSGGEQLFRMLKYRHVNTVMVRFPGESHELSRSGVPAHRIERLDHITGWFGKYLMDKSEPEYDVVTPKEHELDR
ncbi:S9 family peptidase [Alloacidobacterium dinghuense]|uniref:S9 family peptidase n=1 Tax=Alloacidobacterium dinghuense TaxID=2763107 RepID=A0A7G8BDA6_9BACT|nr:S9 family peptidase [Alloacidobacterium dinghuense]QNI30526.1 S9 family peptidase [Alloacidobacterium dinghuense]